MRPVWMLSATQALCMSGSFLFVLLGGIIGSHLAPSPALSTLPVSVLIVGLAASVVPAGALIHRFGRRAVFAGSALQAAAGCVLAGYAITQGSFWLFCAAAFLLGANNAVVMQYRFAADRIRGAGAGEPRDLARHVRRPGRGLARPGARGAQRRPGAARRVRRLVLRRHRALPRGCAGARAHSGLDAGRRSSTRRRRGRSARSRPSRCSASRCSPPWPRTRS